MPTFPSVSLILFADPGQTDQRIWKSVEALGRSQWRTQVLIVENDQSEQPSERITYRPTPTRFKNIVDAIKFAKHPLIGIADQGIEVDSDQWMVLAKRADQSPIQSAYTNIVTAQLRTSRLDRALFWIYSVIVRVLLRTSKTEFDRGLTLFQRGELELLMNEHSGGLACRDTHSERGIQADTGAFCITRLLALARMNRRPVSESQIDRTVDTTVTERVGWTKILNSIQNALRFWWNEIMFPRQKDELPGRKYKSSESTIAIVILMLLAAFVLFRGLNYPLFEPDEARNAQLAMNIVESGQWLSLTLADDYYWDKPPLQIWAIAASYKLLGISQFATRFPVAVASMLTLLMTLLMGRKLVGARPAWLGTLLLLLTTGFVVASRYVTMDASLTAMTTSMFLFGFVALKGRFSKRCALAAGVACGIGILVKGPVIGVLCLPPMLAAFWLSPTSQARPNRWWLWFAVPAILICAPWFVATAIIHPDFLTYFFWKHHVVRFSDAFNHREPFWYYFVGIFVFMFPASYLIPSVTKFLTSRKPENRLFRTRELGFLFLSGAWIIAFFSISESKLPTYIVPSFPLICLLMGVLLDQKLFARHVHSVEIASDRNGSPKRTWLERIGRRAPIEMLVWCFVTSLAILVFFRSETQALPTTGLAVGALVLLSLALVSITFRSKPKIAWSCAGLIGLMMVTLFTHQLIPAISTHRSIHLAASRIQSSEPFKNAPVVFFGRETYGATLKLAESDITWFDDTQTISMINFLNDNPRSIIVSSKDPMETLRRDLPWTIILEECAEARHLYVSRPNSRVLSHRNGQTTHR